MVTPRGKATHGFSRQMRLLRGGEFQRVYRYRCTAADDLLLVYGAANDVGTMRLGLSVSRKVGRAVRRNRWKRLIREAFRRHREQLPAAFDFVVLPRRSDPPPAAEIAQSLVRLTADVARRAARRRAPRAGGERR